MEVTMSNTNKPVKEPVKGSNPNPNPNAISEKTIKISEIPAFLGEQRKQVYINRQKELEKFQMISDNTFHALVKEGNPFYAMRQLNAAITNKILGSLIDELILLRDEANPIDCIRDNPLKKVWSGFFESYDGKTAKTLTNQANPSQSYRNMLATFPSKIKSIMKELVNQGLVTQWQVASTKKSLLEEWQIDQVNDFLVKQGVYNASMDLANKYKVFKALKGKFIEPKKTETETETE